MKEDMLVTPDSVRSRMSGSGVETRLREKAIFEGWDGYLPDNFPMGGDAGIQKLRKDIGWWLNNHQSRGSRTYTLVVTGNVGTGKTYLAHLLTVRALLVKPLWKAIIIRDHEALKLLSGFVSSPEWHYNEDREMTPSESFVSRMPGIVVIDDFMKSPVEYGRGDMWTASWLEIISKLQDSNRMLVVCSNQRNLEERERSLPGSDGTTPVASRLSAKDVRRINLAGKDMRKL